MSKHSEALEAIWSEKRIEVLERKRKGKIAERLKGARLAK